MRRIGIAVGELNGVFRAGHEGVVDGVAHDHAAHRRRTIGDALGEGEHVRQHAVTLGGEGKAEPAIAGDDFVEDQQNAVLLGDLAQPLEVALRRRQHAGRSRHRFHDHGGDGGGAMQIDQPLQLVGEMRAIFRLALAEGLLVAVVGVRKVIDAGQKRAEHLAVVDDAAHRGAAEADAMIAALAADQPGAGALAVDLVIGQRDLQRGVGGLRSGIAEEYVVEAGGREVGDAACKLERLGNAELERRRVVQRLGLFGDRRGNLGAAVAGIAAPHAGGGIDDLAAVDGDVMHILGAGEQPRRFLEGPVGGERHPVRGKVVGDVDGGGEWALVQHGGLFEFWGVAGFAQAISFAAVRERR